MSKVNPSLLVRPPTIVSAAGSAAIVVVIPALTTCVPALVPRVFTALLLNLSIVADPAVKRDVPIIAAVSNNIALVWDEVINFSVISSALYSPIAFL